jgi:CRP-like cAMP-binding protein
MHVSERSAKNFLSKNGWLSQMPAEMREAILENCRCINISAGQHLFEVGGPMGAMFGLASGCVAFDAAQTEDMTQKGLLAHPGLWFGNGPIAGLKSRLVGASATRSSTVLALDFADHRRLASSYPEIWRYQLLLQIEITGRVIGLAQDLMRRSSRERLIAILARLAGLTEPDPPKSPTIDATQSEIAMIANLSRTVVSKHLIQLEHDGIVRLKRAMIEVLDAEALFDQIQKQ